MVTPSFVAYLFLPWLSLRLPTLSEADESDLFYFLM
jgi:hypothetical protein